MNSNYEFNKQVAKEKQGAFSSEARLHRLANQAGSRKRQLTVAALFNRAWAGLHNAVHWSAERAGGSRSNLKTRLHWPGAAAL